MKSIGEYCLDDGECQAQLEAIKKICTKYREKSCDADLDPGSMTYAYVYSTCTFELVCNKLPDLLEITPGLEHSKAVDTDSVLLPETKSSVTGFHAKLGNEDDERTWNKVVICEKARSNFYLQQPCELVLTELDLASIPCKECIELKNGESRVKNRHNTIILSSLLLLGGRLFGSDIFSLNEAELRKLRDSGDLFYRWNGQARTVRMSCLASDETTDAIISALECAEKRVEACEIFKDFTPCGSYEGLRARLRVGNRLTCVGRPRKTVVLRGDFGILQRRGGRLPAVVVSGAVASGAAGVSGESDGVFGVPVRVSARSVKSDAPGESGGADGVFNGSVRAAGGAAVKSGAPVKYEGPEKPDGHDAADAQVFGAADVLIGAGAGGEAGGPGGADRVKIPVCASAASVFALPAAYAAPENALKEPAEAEATILAVPVPTASATAAQTAVTTAATSVSTTTTAAPSMRELRKRNREMLEGAPPPPHPRGDLLSCLFDAQKLEEYARLGGLNGLNIPAFLRAMQKIHLEEAKFLPAEMPEPIRAYFVRNRDAINQQIEEINNIMLIFQILVHHWFFKCYDKAQTVAHYLAQRFRALGLPKYEPGCATGEMEETDSTQHYVAFAADLITDQETREFVRNILKAL